MTLPAWLNLFAPLFSGIVWESVVVLLVGAILAPGKRAVSDISRTLGLAAQNNYQRNHRVLNRAVWSSRKASGILLGFYNLT
jgi:hypothetical protein